jgi:hypothetical protein
VTQRHDQHVARSHTEGFIILLILLILLSMLLVSATRPAVVLAVLSASALETTSSLEVAL